MLVLTRKSNQSIMIGDDIEVSVLVDHGREGPHRHPGPAGHPRVPQRGLPRDPAGAAPPRATAPAKRSTRRCASSDQRLSTRPRRRAERRSAAPSAHHVVQRLEHRDGDEHRGGDQREGQQPEAHRAVLVRRWRTALAGALRPRCGAAARGASDRARSPRRTLPRSGRGSGACACGVSLPPQSRITGRRGCRQARQRPRPALARRARRAPRTRRRARRWAGSSASPRSRGARARR